MVWKIGPAIRFRQPLRPTCPAGTWLPLLVELEVTVSTLALSTGLPSTVAGLNFQARSACRSVAA
jgi:hypothetical protein